LSWQAFTKQQIVELKTRKRLDGQLVGQIGVDKLTIVKKEFNNCQKNRVVFACSFLFGLFSNRLFVLKIVQKKAIPAF